MEVIRALLLGLVACRAAAPAPADLSTQGAAGLSIANDADRPHWNPGDLFATPRPGP